jgi:hypothetical protein
MKSAAPILSPNINKRVSFSLHGMVKNPCKEREKYNINKTFCKESVE